MSKNVTFSVTEKQYSAVMVQITERYNIEPDGVVETKYNIWDTFDWKILRGGYLLSQSEKKFTLIDNDEPLFFERLENVPEQIRADSFKGEGFSNQIGKMILNRAVLQRTKVSEKRRHFKVLNEDSKIILHLDVDEMTNRAEIPFRYFQLRSLRGYESETKQFGKFLLSVGAVENEDTYPEKVLGIKSDELYSPKMNLHLNPVEDSQVASKNALAYMLSMAAQNIDGVIDDIDIEFLHDFRVYTRRFRSYITQVKGIFPQDVLLEMKKDFSFIASKTGPTRDLDVYLEDEKDFLNMVPDEMRAGLHKFFVLLSKNRTDEFNKLKSYMKSAEFKSAIDKWEKFFKEDSSYTELNSQRPITETANIFIMKKYKKIVKSIQVIHEHSDDILMHDLRIECKKLRYLLEAFSSLYNKKQMTRLIRELKKFQDYLGLLNDLSVQKETLRSYLRILGEYDDSIMIASSVGALIVKLDEKHRELKGHFIKTLKEYEQSESHKIYRDLFGG
jgi:CHAD domain-containing protein